MFCIVALTPSVVKILCWLTTYRTPLLSSVRDVSQPRQALLINQVLSDIHTCYTTFMTTNEIAGYRLRNQSIDLPNASNPHDIISKFGAIQAQDYISAKWAIGLRMKHCSDAVIEQEFNKGNILRTHVLRPTWHFITPKDIKWLLMLSSARIKTLCEYYNRLLGLDELTFKKSNALITDALQGNNHLTRNELAHILNHSGISTENPRLVYLLLRAELDGIICSGVRRKKQFTYALLEERAPQACTLTRDEALRKLALTYYSSHGPASLRDFIWWSGMTKTDAKLGLEMIKKQLLFSVINDETYWYVPNVFPTYTAPQKVYLLPNFDEYVVGYSNRTAIYDIDFNKKLDARQNVLFQHTIILNGRVIGTWKRKVNKKGITFIPKLFSPINPEKIELLKNAVDNYGKYLETSINLQFSLN